MPQKRSGKILKWSLRTLLAIVLVVVALIGFGTNSTDAAHMRNFADAVERWQHNPDFRSVQIEYVELGSDSIRSTFCGCNTTALVMWLRSLPGLPEHLRADKSSQAHYDGFSSGRLSAYLKLSAEQEQGLADTLQMLHSLAIGPTPTDADIRNFLSQYKLHIPVVSDAGAIQSVRSLIADAQPQNPFPIVRDFHALLIAHISNQAVSNGYPPNPQQLNPEQQQYIWKNLDQSVKAASLDLWRAKQVNDWLNGVWGQVYGPTYSGLIGPSLTLRTACMFLAPGILIAWFAIAMRNRRQMQTADEQEPADQHNQLATS